MNRDIFMELMVKREYKAVRSILDVMNTVDIASLLEELDDREMATAFRLIPKEKAADVFSNMNNAMQSHLVQMFTDQELKELLDDLYMDDTVDLLEELPANLVTQILETVDGEKRAQINILLNYPQDSAGSIMTTEYVDLRKDNTVAQALAHIKKTGIHKETIYTCYVLDNRKLAGIVSAKDLMTMDDDRTMEELMETDIISVYTHTDQEEVARLFSKYDLLAIPVLDMEERMVGIVTVDDAWDVAVDEATEDITKMAAMNPSEKSYFDTSVIQHAKNRIVWLLVLMISGTFTGKIIENYQSMLSVVVGLTAAIPMLMDTGGNSGNQTSTLIIRGLALGEITIKDYFIVLFKELRVSLICGTVLAVVNFLRLLIFGGATLPVYLVICAALFCAVVAAKCIGCTLPIFAKLIHLDPALMAGPMITTIVDALTLAIYFALAHAFLL